jgi:GNAT superfamily N-acetyltransferase
MEYTKKIRKATLFDVNKIWKIVEQGIYKRKTEGSLQWQDGYPNLDIIKNDIESEQGYVVESDNGVILGYIVLCQSGEPAYDELKTGWLTYNTPFLVLHRLVVCQNPKIKGLAFWIMKQAELKAKEFGFSSIKVDTNFDNSPMLYIFNKLNYTYAGEVYFRGNARMAFEKQIL